MSKAVAAQILDLPRALAKEVITGLIEMVNSSVHCGEGFEVVRDDDTGQWVLQDVASEDWHLEGYTKMALDVIAEKVK